MYEYTSPTIDMMAAIINTTPTMLKTWLPVALTLIIALYVAFCNAVVAAPAPPAVGVVVGMLETVTKNANTPTAKITNAMTADIIVSGSMNLNFIFVPPNLGFKPVVPPGLIM